MLVASAKLNSVAAAVLTFLVEGEVGGGDVALLVVDLTVDDAQVEDVVGVEEPVPYVVDIGHLVPFGVHLPEIGIAPHDEKFLGQGVAGCPGVEAGQVGVEVPPVAVGEEGDPGIEATFIYGCFQGLLVVGGLHMELGEVVMGCKQVSRQRCDAVKEHGVGVGEGKDDGVFVGELHGHGRSFGAGHPVAADSRRDVLVEHDVFLPPGEVVGVEGGAIRPLHALPQVEGPDGGVVVAFPGLGDVGAECKFRCIPGKSLAGELGGAPAVGDAFEAAAHGTAVVADALHAFEDEGIGGKPFIDGREIASSDHFGQHGRFSVAAGRGRYLSGGFGLGVGGRCRHVLSSRFTAGCATGGGNDSRGADRPQLEETPSGDVGGSLIQFLHDRFSFCRRSA